MKAVQTIVARATGVFAQTVKTSKTEGQNSGQMMSMDNMMKQCRQHCQTASKSMDDMMKMMNDAKQTNDPAKMRAGPTACVTETIR